MGYNPLYRGNVLQVPARASATNYINGTVSTISDGIPVSLDATSKIAPTDASSETSVSRLIGITGAVIAPSDSGPVSSTGRAEKLGVQLSSFSYGDPVYLGKSGTLIKQKPDIGVAGFVAGDFVVFIGVVVKNEFDPSEKDIQLKIQVIGQL